MTTQITAPHAAAFASRQRPWFAVAALLGAMSLLNACSEAEAILPGDREPVRAVLQDAAPADLQTLPPENRSLPIALPQARSNADWTHGIGTPAHRSLHPALAPAPRLIWSARIGKGDSRKQRITAAPVVLDGRIFTLDAGTQVTATSTSGDTLWQRDIRPARAAEGEVTGGGLAVQDDTLFVTSGAGVLTALDVATGTPRWTQALSAAAASSPTVFGGVVYVMAGDNTGWAVDAATGRVRWQVAGTTSVANILGAPTPVVADDLAIFAYGSGDLRAVFRRGGLRRWDASVVGRRAGRALAGVNDVTGAPVIAGDTVYAGNQSGRMVAIDLASGLRKWTVAEGTVDTMYPIGGSVFALSDRNELLRLGADTGARIWGQRLPNFVKRRPNARARIFAHHGPIVAGGLVRVASGDGLLRSFDPTDGTLTDSAQIPSGASTAPIVAEGVLYLVGKNGQLHAFR